MKHDDQVVAMQHYFDESNQQKPNAPPPLKRFPLKNIPLYHAYYHQHMYNTSDLPAEPVRSRSSIRKRASAGEKQISSNISMVLEDLLQWVFETIDFETWKSNFGIICD